MSLRLRALFTEALAELFQHEFGYDYALASALYEAGLMASRHGLTALERRWLEDEIKSWPRWTENAG